MCKSPGPGGPISYLRNVLCYKVKLQHWSQRSLIERMNYSIYHFLCPAWFTQSHVRIWSTYLSRPKQSVMDWCIVTDHCSSEQDQLIINCSVLKFTVQKFFYSIPSASPQNSYLCSHTHSFQLITSPPLYHKFLRVMKMFFPGHEYGTSDFNSMVPRILYHRVRNCVTRAPLVYFIRSWVALSFKVVSQSVRHR